MRLIPTGATTIFFHSLSIILKMILKCIHRMAHCGHSVPIHCPNFCFSSQSFLNEKDTLSTLHAWVPPTEHKLIAAYTYTASDAAVIKTISAS